VVDRAPRWAIRKLTDTYLTLSLIEIGRAAGIEDVAEVRRIVVSMVRLCGYRPLLVGEIPLYSYAFGQIETGEIEASVDADGSVTFADDEPAAVSKAELDRALRVAQEQEQVLRKLDYLQKVRICLLACFVENWANPVGHLGSAKPGRRHQLELELELELALYRRRTVGEFPREPMGRRGVLKNVICVPQFLSRVRRDWVSNSETLVILFCLRACVISVGRNDQSRSSVACPWAFTSSR